jgi:hypothetical protein
MTPTKAKIGCKKNRLASKNTKGLVDNLTRENLCRAVAIASVAPAPARRDGRSLAADRIRRGVVVGSRHLIARCALQSVA